MRFDPLDRLLLFAHRRGIRGRGRLGALLRRNGPYPLALVRTRHGLDLLMNPEGFVEGHVLRAGYYEPPVLDALLASLGEDGVLWDVGANFGLHGLTAARLCPRVRVVCFEPSPDTLALLTRNVAVAGVAATVLPCALGDAAGYAAFHVAGGRNTGISSVRPWPDAEYVGTATVRVETAAALIESGAAPAPTVVKLDVEGYEPEALRGFGLHLRAPSLRAVVFESDEPPGTSEAAALLFAAGFHITPIPTPEEDRTVNYLATRAS